MLKALNLISLYVKDIETTVSFYRELGFELVSNDGSVAEVKLGKVHIQFIAQETASNQDQSFQKDAYGEPKGTGVYINVEVDNANNYFKQLHESGIKPSTEPRDW